MLCSFAFSVSFFKQTGALVRREIRLELRRKYAFGGIALYLLSVVFLVYLSFEKLDDRTWILLFWITLLFTAVNAVAKSFIGEQKERLDYLYTLCSAESIMASRMLYNSGVMILLSAGGLLCYTAMTGFPVQQTGLFFAAMIAGGVAFALIFSMVSAIASKAANAGTLMAVLGFPILIPVLRLLAGAGMQSLFPQSTLDPTAGWESVALICGVDVLVLALAMLLFPYLWRD